MAKVKYYYDTKTLNYQRIEKTAWDKLKNILIYLGASTFCGIILVLIFFQFFDSPKEKRLKREISDLLTQYNKLMKTKRYQFSITRYKTEMRISTE